MWNYPIVSRAEVRGSLIDLNHHEQMWNYPIVLMNSWEIILWTLFPLELSCSARFGRGGSTFLPLSSTGNKDHRIVSHEFGVVQLFLTCSNYSSTQETRTVMELDMSSWQCVTSCAHTHMKLAAHSTAGVWGSLIGLNHPELKWKYPRVLCQSVAQEFKEVR